MSKPIPEHALVVVADGHKATFYRRTGSGAEVSLREERELGSAGFNKETPSGSSPSEHSPKQVEEAGFASHLAQTLKKLHDGNKFEALVIVADPRTLGEVRGAMHKTVEGAVVRTVSKDLTNHPHKALEDALSD